MGPGWATEAPQTWDDAAPRREVRVEAPPKKVKGRTDRDDGGGGRPRVRREGKHKTAFVTDDDDFDDDE